MNRYHVKQIWEMGYWRRQCVIADSFEDAYRKAEFAPEPDNIIKHDYTEVRYQDGTTKIFRGEGDEC
jgi:hypothetical protein